MKIVITCDDTVCAGWRNGKIVWLADAMVALTAELPSLLRDILKKTPRDPTVLNVDVELYKFGTDKPYSLWVEASDIDPAVHEVRVMPYDMVWHVILDWFSSNHLLFPSSSFRYDTGEHGMYNVSHAVKTW